MWMGLGLVGGDWSFSSFSPFSFSSFSLVRGIVVAVVMNGLEKRIEKKTHNYILRINLLLLHSLRPASTSTFCQQ